jgi:hypothetical protein
VPTITVLGYNRTGGLGRVAGTRAAHHAGQCQADYQVKESPEMSRLYLTLLAVGALALPACVTINIYFPAAAAEKAADKIIDEVWQIKKGGEKPAEKPAETPAESK